MHRVMLLEPVMNWLNLHILLLACDAPDPMVLQTQEYVREVAPLIAQSEQIEAHFLNLAGKMTSSNISAEQVAATLQEDVLTDSATLLEAAAAVQTESAQLSVLHDSLEDAWKKRQDAWQQALKAWQERDPDSLEQSISSRQTARDDEERYIFDVNAVLRPYGQQLQLYP
jgi:hypothetical protein